MGDTVYTRSCLGWSDFGNCSLSRGVTPNPMANAICVHFLVFLWMFGPSNMANSPFSSREPLIGTFRKAAGVQFDRSYKALSHVSFMICVLPPVSLSSLPHIYKAPMSIHRPQLPYGLASSLLDHLYGRTPDSRSIPFSLCRLRSLLSTTTTTQIASRP